MSCTTHIRIWRKRAGRFCPLHPNRLARFDRPIGGVDDLERAQAVHAGDRRFAVLADRRDEFGQHPDVRVRAPERPALAGIGAVDHEVLAEGIGACDARGSDGLDAEPTPGGIATWLAPRAV